MQAKRGPKKETQIAKLPPPRADVNEQIRELKERCLKLEKDLKKMTQMVIESETRILDYIKMNIPKTSHTTEEQLENFANLPFSISKIKQR